MSETSTTAPMSVAVQIDSRAAKPTKELHPALQIFRGSSLFALTGFSILCLVVGIMVLVVPATFVDLADDSAVGYYNSTCADVVPSGSPYEPVPVTADRQPFVEAWNQYVNTTVHRPEGVRPRCMPMRFPATGPYRGVVLMYHGFSSCPQEMAILAPPLAAQGYDVIIPLLPGHGNAIVYQPDAPNYLWGFLAMGLSLFLLAVLSCCLCCPCANILPWQCCKDQPDKEAVCGHQSRSRGMYTMLVLLTLAFVVSLVAYISAVTNGDPNSVFCLSLSFEDGVGPGCGGRSEYNDNLPTNAAGYRAGLDPIIDLVRLAPGEKVLAGLSGGGGAALYSGMSTAYPHGGDALFSRQLLIAPYLDVAVIGPYLNNIEDMGLGEIKVDFGNSCQQRREMGKAGYCNYKFNRINAMRQLAQEAFEDLVVLPGTSIEVVIVQGDGTVTNGDIAKLAAELAVLTDGAEDKQSSSCMLTHVDSRHSPLSYWNYIHLVGDEELEWVPELVCQFTAFLANGTALPTDGVALGTSEGVGMQEQCATQCGLPGACAYSCEEDTYLQC